jgi:DNA-directed RNA polymerase subunit L
MAEIQQSTNSADLTQRFIEFIMMQAQQAALCLGQIPHPSTGKPEINLEAARMFIDHLEIVKEKTRGNLNKDEEKILTSILSELQLAFVHIAQGADLEPKESEVSVSEEPKIAEDIPSIETPSAVSTESEDEGKKKFTKSYGA